MSGPKVVEVVTIEERIADCRRLFKRLDALIEAWIRNGEKHGVVSEEDVAATRARRAKLAALMTATSIDEVERQLPAEIGFLADDLERRITQAAEKRAAALKAERRSRQFAASLLQDGDAAGVLSDKTAQALKNATGAGGENAINMAIRELADAAAKTKDEKIRAAAQKFEAGERMTVDAWLVQQGMDDPKVVQIERHIAELGVVGGGAGLLPYGDRLKAAQGAENGRRNLLLDSLALELVTEIKKTRRRSALVVEIASKRDELADAGDANTAGLLARMDAAGLADVSNLEQLNAEAAAVLDRVREAKAADGRRRSVLAALGQLGYEVTEGMSTTWEKKGRVLVRRAGGSGEGVEIGGPANSALLQMRPVRFDGAGDATASDIEIEARWCGDFSKLRASMERSGGTFRIERMIPVGVAPVKTYDVTELEDGRRETAHRPQARELKH